MPKVINLSVVRQCLNDFSGKVGECQRVMAKIDTDFVDGTQKVWNSNAAAGFMSGVVSTFNDFIGQFNSKFQAGINEFAEGVNALARQEQVSTVQAPTLPKVQTFSTWSGVDGDGMNVPNDNEYQGFTTSHLTNNLITFYGILNAMDGLIDTAVNNGLDGSYCTNLRQSIKDLSESAHEVSDTYNSKTISVAEIEDQAQQQLRQNT